MPTAELATRAKLLDLLVAGHNGGVETLLDVGMGYGYSVRLLKPRLEVKFTVGVEIWWPYLLEDVHREAYDCIVNGDMRQVLPCMRDNMFQVVLACDVIEHLEDKHSADFVEELKRVCADTLYMTLPIGPCPQGSAFNNPYERHVSEWQDEDMFRFGFKLLARGNRCAVFGWRKWETMT